MCVCVCVKIIYTVQEAPTDEHIPFFAVAGVCLYSTPHKFFSKVTVYGVFRGEGQLLNNNTKH